MLVFKILLMLPSTTFTVMICETWWSTSVKHALFVNKKGENQRKMITLCMFLGMDTPCKL